MKARTALRVALGVGLALAAAPAVFQMFTRAPGGAQMLADFQPYMKAQVLDTFQGYLDRADGAAKELTARGPALAAARLQMPADTYDRQFSGLRDFEKAMPAAYDNMSGLLKTIHGNLGNYGAVRALPSFRLFPWFFVLPGLLVALAAGLGLRRLRRRESARRPRMALAVLGVGLIAAPLVFQMFGRAPMGAQMLSEFKPIMTTQRITTIQTYFVQMASGEAAIRNHLLPKLRAAGLDDAQLRQQLPQTMGFESIWTKMSNKMAPMLGAMNDNLTHFQGLIALPSFTLFPWFFVLPGLLVVLLAWLARRAPGDQPAAGTDDPFRPALALRKKTT